MSSIKVSILVPICNVERFLDKCLESIVSQTLNEIEVICINDGSKDSSLDIIKKFAAKDSRIVIIDKPNSGYGDSMNRGVERALGEYIGIVESDDFIDKEMFDELYDLAKRYDADVVRSNYNLYWENPERIVFYNNLKINKVITGLNMCRKIFMHSTPAIWSSIYKKKWLDEKNIRFLPTPGASYQDTSFRFKAACLAQRIVLTPKAYLNYRQDNVNSSVKIANREKIMLLHKEYDQIKSFLIDKGLDDFREDYCREKLKGMLWNYGRMDSSFRDDYFKIMHEEINKDGDFWKIELSDLPKFLKWGGYEALMNNKKKQFDMFYNLKTIKGLFLK